MTEIGFLGEVSLNHQAEDELSYKRYQQLKASCDEVQNDQRFVFQEPIKENIAKFLVNDLSLKEGEFCLVQFGIKTCIISEAGYSYLPNTKGFGNAAYKVWDYL
jgi:hypothetical protein